MTRVEKIKAVADAAKKEKQREKDLENARKRKLFEKINSLRQRVADLLEAKRCFEESGVFGDLKQFKNSLKYQTIHFDGKCRDLLEAFNVTMNYDIKNEKYYTISISTDIKLIREGATAKIVDVCDFDADAMEIFLGNFEKFEAEVYAYIDARVEAEEKRLNQSTSLSDDDIS